MPRLSQNTTAPNARTAIGCQKARLASGLLPANGITAGRRRAPARPSGDRLADLLPAETAIEFAASSRGIPLIVCPFQYFPAD